MYRTFRKRKMYGYAFGHPTSLEIWSFVLAGKPTARTLYIIVYKYANKNSIDY